MDSIDLFHALQHVKYARGKLNAWAKKWEGSTVVTDDVTLDPHKMIEYDVQQLDNVETRIKLLLQSIKDGEV